MSPILLPTFCIPEFERRQARPPDASATRGGEEANDLQQKLEEVRQPPPRVRPVPSLVPRPPQTSLVKFVGNIYTFKCRYVTTRGGRKTTHLGSATQSLVVGIQEI